MKKFTKICLTAAAVLAVLGLVLCGVFGALGGFRQLRQIEGKSLYSFIPVTYHNGDWDDWEDAYEDSEEDWEDWDDWDDWEETEAVTAEETSIAAEQITKLRISLKACMFSIQPSKEDTITLFVSGDKDVVRYQTDGETLVIKTKENDNLLRYIRLGEYGNTRIILQIPEAMNLEEVQLEFGAGEVKSMALQADSIEVQLGAGNCEIEGLTADNIDLSIGAGKMIVGSLVADKATVDLGAGEMTIQQAAVPDKMDLQIGMGNAVIDGSITGSLTADCGMGSLQMHLDGAKEDHDYSVDCAMGNVTIGDMGYSGMAASKEIDNDADSRFVIDCAMGNVAIRFDE